MEELIKKIQEEEFDVKTEYCGEPDVCKHDCILPGQNNCSAYITEAF